MTKEFKLLPNGNLRRISRSKRGYDAKWYKFRKLYLARNPICRLCSKLATEIDHIIPLTSGGEKYNEENLQPLCKSCHSRKTMNECRRVNRKSF